MATVTTRACFKSIFPSAKSLLIDAETAFCRVSTLEHTNAIPRTTKPAITNTCTSSKRMKNAAEGSSAAPWAAATVPNTPMMKTSGRTRPAARRDPFLSASSSSEAQARCQFPCENISAAVMATTSAKPDLNESMYDMLPMLQSMSPSGLYAFASEINVLRSPANKISRSAMTSQRTIHAWIRSVRSEAGKPPYAVYAAVTAPTASMGMIGSISARTCMALPIAVNSANKNVNM